MPAASAAKKAYWWKTPRRRGTIVAAIRSLCTTSDGIARYVPGVDADAVELRVLGCLIEKQRTTPDTYPLSLNSLRLACNQATNRDPVVEYDEPTIRAALERLSRKGWTRLASGAGSRAAKYRHLLGDALHVSGPELSVLAVLMLRGPQTPGELKQRTERLHPFASLDAVEEVLARLVERDLAVQLERRPGQKEARHAQLLGGAGDARDDAATTALTEDRPAAADDRLGALEERVARIEASLTSLLQAMDVHDEEREGSPSAG
jgi:uncharacterized protein YceH (UPF0502 family)